MQKVFISHASADHRFVGDLRQLLSDVGQDGWIDSRELRGGDPLWPDIQQAISHASGFAVVVSPASLQSKWVGKELKYAIEVQKERGRGEFPVVALSLDNTKLGVLEQFFESEPFYIPVSSAAGGIEAAAEPLLVAFGKRLAAERSVASQPELSPLEELVLDLSDLKFQERDGMRRPSARARLIYQPAAPERREVESDQSWRFVAPLGPIEAEELRWYLEKFAIWPSEIFRDRARRVEENLARWGQLLHQAALPAEYVANVQAAWTQLPQSAERRFSVDIDATVEAGTSAEEEIDAREAATVLLGLPWELLHDGISFLFQGATPTRVRRRLHNTRNLAIPVMSTPIRILLVTARPEDAACSYLDHRSSALPLVEVMEELGGLVRIHVLSPPTLPALRQELDRARQAHKPYHVVHFDGHGVYDRAKGLGGLCFENPQDVELLERRRHQTVFTTELGPILRDHRIPLIFLEACQTAQAENSSGSVASELLKVGVASVVAMSHSVLVETARRFVQAFYAALANGRRVGEAMLEGQRQLKEDTFRGQVFGAGELKLEDWFVPVLFQEKNDAQLFRFRPAPATKATTREVTAARMGALPPAPKPEFIGRSRELLALQRLLREASYAVVRGQGGEGKTALACEFARWLVRSQQIHRAAFVSVETHSDVQAVIDFLGRQIVGKDYSVLAFEDVEKSLLPLERSLREQSTLLVIDNLESILAPPYVNLPEALRREVSGELRAILDLCARLAKAGETRLVFTSRESLPAPFDGERNRRELQRMDREDAIKFVERVLNANGRRSPGPVLEAGRESITALVDVVHGHARTLMLLAPSLAANGVEVTRATLVELMAAMEAKFPGERERSVFASVELSLHRLSPASRRKAETLAAFFGVVDLAVWYSMMKWSRDEVSSVARELVETGLATFDTPLHLTLNPALCPYLRQSVAPPEQKRLRALWIDATRAYAHFLVDEQQSRAELASGLTLLEIPNLFALLDFVEKEGQAEVTIDLATRLHALVQSLGKPRLIERLGQVRDAAAATLAKTYGAAVFQAELSRIEQQMAGNLWREALVNAQRLLDRAKAAGEDAYPYADYDLASAHFTLGRVLKTLGRCQQALLLLDEAQKRFDVIANARKNKSAEGMVAKCFGERGACFFYLKRFEDAATAYTEDARRHQQMGAIRDVAVAYGQLASVFRNQRDFPAALKRYQEALDTFLRLDEPTSVAKMLGNIGGLYRAMGQREAAEDALQKSLTIFVQQKDDGGQAITLIELGNLYTGDLARIEDGVTFYRRAADKFHAIGDATREGVVRGNLAAALYQLSRYEEARGEVMTAIARKEGSGGEAEPWNTWHTLSNIERAEGHAEAAAEADRKATESFVAHRRAGGENHEASGEISAMVAHALVKGDVGSAFSVLDKITGQPEAEWLWPLVAVLRQIVSGNRDPALTQTPGLDYKMTAEVVLLLQTLGPPAS